MEVEGLAGGRTATQMRLCTRGGTKLGRLKVSDQIPSKSGSQISVCWVGGKGQLHTLGVSNGSGPLGNLTWNSDRGPCSISLPNDVDSRQLRNLGICRGGWRPWVQRRINQPELLSELANHLQSSTNKKNPTIGDTS